MTTEKEKLKPRLKLGKSKSCKVVKDYIIDNNIKHIGIGEDNKEGYSGYKGEVLTDKISEPTYLM